MCLGTLWEARTSDSRSLFPFNEGSIMTASLTILDNIRIASPCSADWSMMVGDDRSRFCGSCQKHVYNLSAMAANEAAQLIREREGNLCARLYRRADGTILTGDCPVGARAVWHRTKRLAVACAAAAFVGTAAWLVPNLTAAGASSSDRPTGGPVVQKTLELWDDLLVWMGIRQRFVFAGAVSIDHIPFPDNVPEAVDVPSP